jgi:hypothetical protein
VLIGDPRKHFPHGSIRARMTQIRRELRQGFENESPFGETQVRNFEIGRTHQR